MAQTVSDVLRLGVDVGSTTSKCVFIDENEQVTDTFYANNQGEPLKVVREGLLALAEKYEKMGIQLEVLGLGTTGYGEQMLSAAFHADYHTVETVAHARGCRRFFPDATFLLDIGGQDMKAIWLKDGVVTNIMLNEACSSGCGRSCCSRHIRYPPCGSSRARPWACPGCWSSGTACPSGVPSSGLWDIG